MFFLHLLKQCLFPITPDAQACAGLIAQEPETVSIQLREGGQLIYVLVADYKLTIVGGRAILEQQRASPTFHVSWWNRMKISRRDERLLLRAVTDWMQTDNFGPVPSN